MSSGAKTIGKRREGLYGNSPQDYISIYLDVKNKTADELGEEARDQAGL